MTQSPEIGDKVQVVYHPESKYIGKLGKIVNVNRGIKPHSQPVNVQLPKTESEPRYVVELDNGVLLSNLREEWLTETSELEDSRSKMQLTEFGESLATQLSGVREGQRDHGRVANVSGHLLQFVIGDDWVRLSERQQHSLISEETPILRDIYEGYLRRGFRTMEAAQEAIKDELDRLPRRFRNLK